ncbi:MAG: type II toxin-antitoxin system RelE/ParE family toxin [Clostridiales bacterium]|jgi:plasmid stabilization system protein ParE|nr:type II toxin-antitoxin system RelE/ParE family toxin [Clostridiales bacterium]
MNFKISISDEAKSDLWEIRQYLARFGENPPRKFKESFDNFLCQVSERPCMFSEYAPNPAYRKAVIEFEYSVFYRVDETLGAVKIYRVLHGRRNYEKIIE